MSDQQRWQEQNTQYLSIALAWLRLRLESLAQHELPQLIPAPVTPPPVQPAPKRGWFRRTPDPTPEPVATPPLPVPAPPKVSNGDLAEYVRQMAEAEKDNDA